MAGLSYVNDRDRDGGLTRVRNGKGFRYVDAEKRVVRDRATLERVKALVIPPAWREVWICRDADGHIQATGLDDRGRKQYRYHAQWREVRDRTKFDRLARFAERLPRIRRRVRRDLALPGLPREKVLAAIVRLLDRTGMRVGNDEYARDNKSYGITTIRNHHAQVRGPHMRFEYTGKSGVHRVINLDDKHLARIVRACQELPGQELFEYIDGAGKRHDVTSTHVNSYLKEISGEEFTAKDFRTWTGTLCAARELCGLGACESETQGKKNVVAAIKATAAALGNTPATCRKYYVHPFVLESYLGRELHTAMNGAATGEPRPAAAGLGAFEKGVLGLLKASGRKRRPAAKD